MTVVPNPDGDLFLAKWNSFYSRVDDITATLGLIPVSGNDHEVVLRMPLRREIRQPVDMFSAAALYSLADICGTFLAMAHVGNDSFPLAVQSSINLRANPR
jgi:acyl-coenzyme A thioesterase PaaI-like protein